MRPSTVVTVMAAIAVAAIAGASCSSDTESPATPDTGITPGIIEPTATPPADDTLETADLPEEEVGTLVNRFDLDPGDCFNTYGLVDTDVEAQPTTRVVACDDAHESEVYYQRNYPAGPEAPYPGADEMISWTEQRCYREFEAFTGATYELSALEIGVIHPTELTWTGPGLHREVTCYVYAVGGGGLQGSMAGSGL